MMKPGVPHFSLGRETDLNLEWGRVYHAVRSRWSWVALFVVAGGIFAALWSFRQPDQYRSTAVIQVNRQPLRLTHAADVTGSDQAQANLYEFLQTQQRILTSRNLAERVIQKLDLEKHAFFQPDPPSLFRDIREGLMTFLPAAMTDPEEAGRSLEPNVTLKGRKQSFTSPALGKYSRALGVKLLRGSVVFEIIFHTSQPELSARLANAHIEEYMAYTFEHRFGLTGRALETLKKEGENLQQQLQIEEEALQQYRVENTMVTNLEKEEELYKENQRQLMDKENEESRLRERYLEKHPKMVEVRSALTKLRSETKLREKLLLDLRQKNIGYEKLRRKAEGTRQMYEAILARIKEVDVAHSMDTTNIAWLDRAIPAEAPFAPRRGLIVALTMILSLGAAIAFCLFQEFTTESLKSGEDVERHLATPFLGYVPLAGSGRKLGPNLVQNTVNGSNESYQRALTESFRTILLVIDHQAQNGQPKRVIVLTSAIPGEGKSFCALGLSALLAKTGQRTLLIDADLRRPSLADRLGLKIPEGLGLQNLVHTDKKAEQFVQPTGLPGLDAVLTLPSQEEVLKILTGPLFARFLEDLRPKYDRIIIDTAPIGAVGDVIPIASHADGALWITRFGQLKRMVKPAFERFVKVHPHIFGVILNGLDPRQQGNNYYYAYSHYEKYYRQTQVS